MNEWLQTGPREPAVNDHLWVFVQPVWRRLAKRYEKLAAKRMAIVLLAAVIYFWFNPIPILVDSQRFTLSILTQN
jgi:superfamily I DNA and/or RNA helicase